MKSPVIEVKGLVKRYGDAVAVKDVSFSVEAGEIFGILGPNGAGKTTTVEALTGLQRIDGGQVRVLGVDPQAHPWHWPRRACPPSPSWWPPIANVECYAGWPPRPSVHARS